MRNLFLLAISYFFYGYWDWRFLGLIAFSSGVDYLVGLRLEQTQNPKNRKLLLSISLLVNLGLLCVFKYYNFFINSFVEGFSSLGVDLNINTLKIILPVGISFYTFQTLSYTIDVYRKKLEPTKDVIAFFAFVSFFPQLVAGPIERASALLPQFKNLRKFNLENAKNGLRYILWGMFKKVVIADTAAIMVNDIFKNHEVLPASVLILGAIYFAFQIYADFSGYSDIAIGTAKFFGFNLMTNFRYPYFSRDMAEFWRRWHISLSTWFRDYVYIPLGGSRGSRGKVIRNIFAIFLISGFWHGANWTFIFWGALNACYFIPIQYFDANRKNLPENESNTIFVPFKEMMQILVTFILTCFAWIFFRAESLSHAFAYIADIFQTSLFEVPEFRFLKYLPLIVVLVGWEWLQRSKLHGLELGHIKTPIRWMIYIALLFVIIYFFGEEQAFIYFQF